VPSVLAPHAHPPDHYTQTHSLVLRILLIRFKSSVLYLSAIKNSSAFLCRLHRCF